MMILILYNVIRNCILTHQPHYMSTLLLCTEFLYMVKNRFPFSRFPEDRISRFPEDKWSDSQRIECPVSHVVVIVRLPHVRFRNPVKTLVGVVLSLGHKDVTAIAERRAVGEVESRETILPIPGSPTLCRCHIRRHSRQVLFPHVTDFNVEILIGRSRHQ